MDRIFMLSDIHGNMEALRAIEREIERIRPDQIWFIGDSVGKGPDSFAAFEWVEAHCDHIIAGNWDLMLYRKAGDPRNSAIVKQLGPERLQRICGYPLELELVMSGIRFRVMHGRPTYPLRSSDAPESEFEPMFKGEITEELIAWLTDYLPGLNSDLIKDMLIEGPFTGVIYGDCHRAFVRQTQYGVVLNTGSVGNALGVTGAHALLIEGELGATEKRPIYYTFINVPYDVEAEVQRVTEDRDMFNPEAFIREIRTGQYSR